MAASVIQNEKEIISLISSCKVCNVAMVDENEFPYVLPFNFGIKDDYIWFHCGLTGKKVDILKSKPNVCVVFSGEYEFGHRHQEVACSYYMKYKSVMITGAVEFIDDSEQKQYGMNAIMEHYTGKGDFTYNKPAINNILIFRLKIENVSGRQN